MKKLDEIMELMADEMQDFKEGLLQLKKNTDELQSRSIPISTEVLEKHLNFFFEKQQEKEALVAERFNGIEEKLKKAYILPKSLGIIVGAILILLISLVGYLTFELKEASNEKFEVDQIRKKERTEVNDRNFF